MPTQSPRLFEIKVGSTTSVQEYTRFTLNGQTYALVYEGNGFTDLSCLILTVPTQTGVYVEVLRSQGERFGAAEFAGLLPFLFAAPKLPK